MKYLYFIAHYNYNGLMNYLIFHINFDFKKFSDTVKISGENLQAIVYLD